MNNINISNKNKKIIIISGFLVLIILIIILFLLSHGKKDNLENNNVDNTNIKSMKKNDINTSEEKAIIKPLNVQDIEVKQQSELSKNIEVIKKYYDDTTSEVKILAKNNNNIPISYTVYLNYLDKTGKETDTISGTGYANPNKEFVVSIYNGTYENYNNYNLSIEANSLLEEETPYYIDDNSLISTQETNKTRITYNNFDNLDKILYLSIIYYKNNEPISYYSDSIVFDYNKETNNLEETEEELEETIEEIDEEIEDTDEEENPYVPEIIISEETLPSCSNNNSGECYDNYKVIVSGAIGIN